MKNIEMSGSQVCVCVFVCVCVCVHVRVFVSTHTTCDVLENLTVRRRFIVSHMLLTYEDVLLTHEHILLRMNRWLNM